MSHMFCTLQEAAQTLHASEDEIQALLERGLLQEFREGPHRLLKEADVGALARRQAQCCAQDSPAPPQARTGPRSPSRDYGAKADAARAGSRPPQGPRPQGMGSRRPPHGMTPPGRRATPYTEMHDAGLRRSQEPGLRRPSGRLSLRDWFWMGLIQDRPGAIALLSGLVLALLAALVAGLWFLAHAA